MQTCVGWIRLDSLRASALPPTEPSGSAAPLLHGPSVLSGANAKARFHRIVQAADCKASHALMIALQSLHALLASLFYRQMSIRKRILAGLAAVLALAVLSTGADDKSKGEWPTATTLADSVSPRSLPSTVRTFCRSKSPGPSAPATPMSRNDGTPNRVRSHAALHRRKTLSSERRSDASLRSTR